MSLKWEVKLHYHTKLKKNKRKTTFSDEKTMHSSNLLNRLWSSGIGSSLERNRLWVWFLAVSDIYPMFIEPTITWVSSGLWVHMARHKNCVKNTHNDPVGHLSADISLLYDHWCAGIMINVRSEVLHNRHNTMQLVRLKWCFKCIEPTLVVFMFCWYLLVQK